MGYSSWLESEWKVFWHISSGDTLQEQRLAVWNAREDPHNDKVFTYEQIKGGVESLKNYFKCEDLSWDELIPIFERWLLEVEEEYNENFIQD